MFVQSLNKFVSSHHTDSRPARAALAAPTFPLSRSDWQRLVAEMLD